MPTLQIIGLGHRSGRGKDTLYKILRRRGHCDHNANVLRYSFADQVKNMAGVVFSKWGLKDAAYYDDNYLEKDVVLPGLGLSPRQIWNRFGTNVCRDIYANTWTERLEHEIMEVRANIDSRARDVVAVVTDVRFPEEVSMMRRLNSTLVEVTASAPIVKGVSADEKLAAYRGWDLSIHNDMTEGFEAVVIKTLGPILNWSLAKEV